MNRTESPNRPLDLHFNLKQRRDDLYTLKERAALHGALVPVELSNKIQELETEVKRIERAVSELPHAETIYLKKLLQSDQLMRWCTLFVPFSAELEENLSDRSGSLSNKFSSQALFRPEFESLDMEQRGNSQRIVRRRIEDLFEAINKHDRFVLLGPPGSGKTTALERLAWEMSRRIMLNEPDSQTPILLRLGDYVTEEGIVDWVASELDQRWGASLLGQNLEHMLNEGRLLILFDALNEMPFADYGHRLYRLQQFLRKLPAGNRVIVSCRILDYEPELGPQRVEILPLDPSRVQQLYELYLGKPSGVRLFDETIKGNLLRLARIPYFAAMLAYLFSRKQALPINQGRLLQSFINTLFSREDKLQKRHLLPSQVQILFVQKLAFIARLQVGAGATLEMGWALSNAPSKIVVRGITWQVEPEILLRLAASANIIEISPDWRRLRFSHELIQDYLAGKELLQLSLGKKEITRFWQIPWFTTEVPKPRKSSNWRTVLPPPTTGWEQATILAAGCEKDGSVFIKSFLRTNPLLAARCIVEGQATVSPSIRQSVISSLLETINNANVSARVRVAAGDLLGELGDPRIDPVPMLRVAAGEFQMGNDGVDAFGNPMPRHPVVTDEFLISKYPVTYQEYASFLGGGGYDNKEWWTEEGWGWRKKLKRGKPPLWDERVSHYPNSPVVGISWYEAFAFAQWAEKRLPTEAEWEKAASWDSERKQKTSYPWGDIYDSCKLNINDGNEVTGRITPIGTYPEGASHVGACDMAGNVWEWCSSEYKPYPYSPNDGREDMNMETNRVMRGGTFWSEPAFANCSTRFRHFPGYRFDVGGFRLATG